jgi:excisionase family DNA binding protein
MTTREPLIGVREAADFLSISERRLYAFARAGQVPAYRVGGLWKFRESELEEWLQRQRRGGETP